MSQRPVLVLVDGSAYLYRAYHALPELTSSSGEPTGAIHGVLTMLNKLIRDMAPENLAVVFDAPGPTFRDELFAEYKANRPPMPDDLKAQIQPLLDAVQWSGIPLLRVAGVEADDVIGSLATSAVDQGMDVVIVTGDKDMAQIVNAHVTLLDTMPRGPSRKPRPLDLDGVKEKFGVRADQIIDYLALVGDSSDNIPGVPKVGPKSAAALLSEYDHVDDILGDLEGVAALSIRGAKSLAQRIGEHQDTLQLSKELATIRLDVELDQEPSQLLATEPDVERLRQLYEHLELRRLLDALPESESATAQSESPEFNYETIQSQERLDHWLEKIVAASVVALDTETTSLNYMEAQLVGLSFSVEPGEAAYLPVGHTGPDQPLQLDRELVLERLRPWLENPEALKLGHHLKYDAHVLENHGIELKGIAWDTMLESYLLDSTATRHDLDSVSRFYLGRETIHYEEVAGKGAKQISFDQVALEQAAPYAAEDADVALQLHQTLWPLLESAGKAADVFSRIERPLIPVLQRMEHYGVRIDAPMLEKQSLEFAKQLEKIEKQAFEVADRPFNLGSPKQLQEILFGQLNLPVLRKTPKGQPSTAEDVLQDLASEHDLPRLILEHRALAKLKSTYTDKLPRLCDENGRVHTSYHQAVAATGRLSSSDPNLQNIPVRTSEGRRIRQAFIADDGNQILAADYSQIELRIMAHLSGDQGLLDAFAKGVDIHQATAAEVFDAELDQVTSDQRRSAKAINFGLIYGMSPFGLSRQLNIPLDEAQSYVDLYFQRYPGVKAYMDRTRAAAKEQGYVETVFGRRLHLHEINARQAQRRQYAERSAINAPMQGTAADIIKLAMISVDAWLASSQLKARLIMQVHDELVLEVDSAQIDQVTAGLKQCMEGAADLSVELKLDLGTGANWDQAH